MRSAAAEDDRSSFLDFYDTALPRVYGYLATRCGPPALAEDLTAETFLAAVDATRRDHPPDITVPWIIGVARHKLVDHWRRQARDERRLSVLVGQHAEPADPCDERLDAVRVRHVLDAMAAQHRAALTLRYLLVRARSAFRRSYQGEEETDA